MKIFVKGKGKEELNQRQFVAAGGEKQIYVKGNVAYNIYIDPANCIPEAKIKELSVLQLPNIIRPQNLILDTNNRLIGYTSQWVAHAEAFCKFFTKAYKMANSITQDQTTLLVHRLQDIIKYIHSKGIVVVDLNELNFLVNKLLEIYAIDTNSYQTPSFPATVIMPSIRDWHTQGFNEGSDWFSDAILVFNLKIGIHPYKGTHPDFMHLPIADRLIARMKANVSAFNPKTTLPKVCEPFDVLPAGLRKWLFAVLEKGERLPPPDDYESVVAMVQVKQIAGSNLFEIKMLESYNNYIYGCYTAGPTRLTLTDKGFFLNKEFKSYDKKLCAGFTPKMDWPVGIYLSQDTLHIVDLRNPSQDVEMGHAKYVFRCENRLYAVMGNDVLEVAFAELGNRLLPSLKVVGRVLDMPDATKAYDGVVIQQVLDRYVASIFPATGKSYQINLQELDGYRVLDAKYEKNVLMLVAEKGGKYNRFVMRFSPDFGSHDMRVVEDIDYADLNFTVTDAGICTMINEDEKIEAFSNKKDAGTIKIMEDPAIDGTMRLWHDGIKVMFSKDDKLYSIKIK